MKKKTLVQVLLLVCLLGLLGLFLVSAYHLLIIQAERNKEQGAFDQLAQIVSAHTQPATETQVPMSTESAKDPSGTKPSSVPGEEAQIDPLPQYLPLYEKNEDFFAWIRIDGTNINYPVMHTPWDPEHYLRRAFDGTDSHSGTPFLDGDCAPEGSYYLIYGHNLVSGTMFSELPNYADPDFARSHPVIHLDTRYEQREYQLVTAFFSRVYTEEEEGGFRYYDYRDLSEPEDFDAFIQGVQAAALYDLGISVSFGDELLTLSTCNYHTEEGRFALVAKRIK